MKIISKFKAVTALFVLVALFSCKKDDNEAEPTLIAKWNFISRVYQETGAPADTENYSGKGYYIDLKENRSYTVLFEGDNGTGTYTVTNNKISFDIVSGDDDITDEDTYEIKSLSNTELILEEKDATSTYQLRFTR